MQEAILIVFLNFSAENGLVFNGVIVTKSTKASPHL